MVGVLGRLRRARRVRWRRLRRLGRARLDWPASLAVREALEELDEELRRWANRQLPDDHEPFCPVARKDVPPRADCYCYLAGPRGVVRKLKVKVQDMERHKYRVGEPVRFVFDEMIRKHETTDKGLIVGRSIHRLTGEPEYWVEWQDLGGAKMKHAERELEIDPEAEGGVEAIERNYGPMRRRLRRLRRWVRS